MTQTIIRRRISLGKYRPEFKWLIASTRIASVDFGLDSMKPKRLMARGQVCMCVCGCKMMAEKCTAGRDLGLNRGFPKWQQCSEMPYALMWAVG